MASLWLRRLDEIERGHPYLTERYGNEPLREECALLRVQGLPDSVPLYACRLFARRNEPKVNASFDDWRRGCIEYAKCDQAMFSYVTWKHGLRIKALDFRESSRRWLKLHAHRDAAAAGARIGARTHTRSP